MSDRTLPRAVQKIQQHVVTFLDNLQSIISLRRSQQDEPEALRAASEAVCQCFQEAATVQAELVKLYVEHAIEQLQQPEDTGVPEPQQP